MFPDLWLAELPLVLCFFPPWVPSWSPLISANLRPLVTSHPHGFALSVSLWTPSELLFWTLKCILAAGCDWLSARSATWQIRKLIREEQTIFPEKHSKSLPEPLEFSHRLPVCDCRGMKVAIPDDRIVVSHLIWRVWLFCPQVRLQGLEVIGLKRRPGYNHIMWTNWIQSNWRWCHPVSLWITWTAPLISVQRLSHSSPLEIVCLLGKPTLMHLAIGVSIKQHNGNPANDRLTNIVKKTIQTKQKKQTKKTHPEESQYIRFDFHHSSWWQPPPSLLSHTPGCTLVPSSACCRSIIGGWQSLSRWR